MFIFCVVCAKKLYIKWYCLSDFSMLRSDILKSIINAFSQDCLCNAFERVIRLWPYLIGLGDAGSEAINSGRSVQESIMLAY